MDLAVYQARQWQQVGAWAAEGALAKIGPSDGQVFDDFADEYLDIWQEIGEKLTVVANLQPTSPMPPKLLGAVRQHSRHCHPP